MLNIAKTDEDGVSHVGNFEAELDHRLTSNTTDLSGHVIDDHLKCTETKHCSTTPAEEVYTYVALQQLQSHISLDPLR